MAWNKGPNELKGLILEKFLTTFKYGNDTYQQDKLKF